MVHPALIVLCVHMCCEADQIHARFSDSLPDYHQILGGSDGNRDTEDIRV